MHKTFTLKIYIEMFYMNSTLIFGIPPVLVFQLEVYYKVERLLTGLTAQQKGTTDKWVDLYYWLDMYYYADCKYSFIILRQTKHTQKCSLTFNGCR